MTIKYLDSKRISALSSDFPTTTTTYDHIGDTNNAGLHAINTAGGHDGTKVGIKIIAGSPAIGTKIEYVSMSIRKWGSSTGNYQFQVIDGTDGTTVLASATSSASALTETPATVELQLDSVVTLSVNDRIVLAYPDGSGSNIVGLARNSATTESGYNRAILGYSTTTWTDSTTNNMIMIFDSSPATVSKPTNVEDNSILVEKDTTRRYWFGEALAPTFEDDFDNSDNWTPSGSTISITGNKVVGNTVTGSTDRIYWDATHVALSDTKWVTTFNYKVSVVGVDSEHTPLAFSAGTAQIRTSSQDYLGFDVYGQSASPTRNIRLNYRDGTSNGYSSSKITPTLDRQYYCTMSRDGVTLTLSLFTDEARTTHETGSPISITNVPSTVVGLTHAQITAWNGSSSNSSWEVDTLKIYNGVTSITPATWECSNFGKSLTNLHAWYDASDVSSITKDSSNRVSQFNDKSGNGRHLSQATSGSQPLWVSEGQNGKDLIDCVGSRFMKTSTWTAISQPYTFFFTALMPLNDSADRMLMDSISNTSLIYKQTTNDRFLMYAGSNAGATMSGYANTWRYVTAIFDGTNLTYRFDGVHKNTEGSTVGTGTSNGLILGARDGSGFSNSKFGEIIMIAGNPTAQEITDTEAYLKDKWGL